MSRRSAADLQAQVVPLHADADEQRARDVAASVDAEVVTRLAARATPPKRGQGRPPVHTAIDASLYAAFEAKLREAGLSKRAVVEQLIAGYVGREPAGGEQ